MTATEELRRMLDERGVEYEGETDGDGWAFTRWHGFDDTGWLASSDELCGLLDLRGRYLFTPEQAIEATLGRGTCEVVYERLGYRCKACGARFFLDDDSGEPNFYDECGRATFPNYCPNCGRKVVE